MGIQTTVKATRAASLDDLLALCLRRLDRMLLTGTTTVEAKSGYGLNLEDEIKQLEVLRDLAALHPVDIVPTFMGAHDVPPEYRDRREEYIQLLIGTLNPRSEEARPSRIFRRLLRARCFPNPQSTAPIVLSSAWSPGSRMLARTEGSR
jgi:imidazolonepropionase